MYVGLTIGFTVAIWMIWILTGFIVSTRHVNLNYFKISGMKRILLFFIFFTVLGQIETCRREPVSLAPEAKDLSGLQL